MLGRMINNVNNIESTIFPFVKKPFNLKSKKSATIPLLLYSRSLFPMLSQHPFRKFILYLMLLLVFGSKGTARTKNQKAPVVSPLYFFLFSCIFHFLSGFRHFRNNSWAKRLWKWETGSSGGNLRCND